VDAQGDGFGDLVVGADGEEVGPLGRLGAMFMIYGSATGLDGDGAARWSSNSPGMPPGGTEEFDIFAAAVGAGDFDGDGRGDVAVGVPYGTDTEYGIGLVYVMYSKGSGLGAERSMRYHQDTPGYAGEGNSGDQLGRSFAGWTTTLQYL
jgi:hypothetical protein